MSGIFFESAYVEQDHRRKSTGNPQSLSTADHGSSLSKRSAQGSLGDVEHEGSKVLWGFARFHVWVGLAHLYAESETRHWILGRCVVKKALALRQNAGC